MEIGTAVFRRIVRETEERIYKKAVEAIADTMEETYRFGCFRRDYIKGCAEKRLNKLLNL